MPEGSFVKKTGNYRKGIPFLTDGKAKVLAQDGGVPTLTVNKFGSGMGIYMASFEKTIENTRLLLNLILLAGGEDRNGLYLTDNCCTECAYYPGSGQLVVINNSDMPPDNNHTDSRRAGGSAAGTLCHQNASYLKHKGLPRQSLRR